MSAGVEVVLERLDALMPLPPKGQEEPPAATTAQQANDGMVVAGVAMALASMVTDLDTTQEQTDRVLTGLWNYIQAARAEGVVT